MSEWLVSVEWSTTVEADDEGEALMAADLKFSFMNEANADEIGEVEDE